MDTIIGQWNDPEHPEQDFLLTKDSTIEEFQSAFTSTVIYATNFGVTATDEQRALADTLGPQILEEAGARFGNEAPGMIILAAVLAAIVVATGDKAMIDQIVKNHATGRDDYGIPFDEVL